MTDAAAHPWHADLERLRARRAQPGLADPQRVLGLSHLVDAEGRLYSHGTTTCMILAPA